MLNYMLNFRGAFAIPLHIFAGDESPSKGANGGTAGCGLDSLSSPGWKHQKTWEVNWNPASKVRISIISSDFVQHFRIIEDLYHHILSQIIDEFTGPDTKF